MGQVIMDNFWIKVAVAVVVIVGVVVAINKFRGPKTEKKEQPEKTVYDVWQQDEKRLRAEPNVAPAAGANQPGAVEQKPIKFKELTEEQKAGAEQLFEWAIKSREMARLPGVGYKQMVDACRDIIERYPGSEFDYKARRILGEVPERERERYHITEKELIFPQ
jgi:hypothetical protein